MCQTVSIVSGNGLLPFQHQAISSVPEPCWLKINWTLRNNPVKFISPCYLIHLYITVHKIWIELNWNWKKINWIGIELKDSESDLNWNWIELKNPESNLNWNWIELKEMNWSEPWRRRVKIVWTELVTVDAVDVKQSLARFSRKWRFLKNGHRGLHVLP